MILSCAEMKALEEKAFATGITAESLMEDAGRKIHDAVVQFFPVPGCCAVWFGKGHNGGDALVAARLLVSHGWQIILHSPFPEEAWAKLTRKKHAELEAAGRDYERSHLPALRAPGSTFLVLDGLLGIGAGGPLREPIRSATREINRHRTEKNAQVFAIDLPTGLDADSGEADLDCVVADFTLTVGFAKKGLFADHATDHVGRLAVVPLAELTRLASSITPPAIVATGATLSTLLPRRKFESNKSTYGRVGILAGAVGTTGAAVMSAEAALRGGAGLITLFSAIEIYPTLAQSCPPEIMVHPIGSPGEVLQPRLDVLGIGPGLGKKYGEDVLEIIEKCPLPIVVDADALNLIAEAGVDLLARCAGPRLLTPHPGEMARLFPESKKLVRLETALAFTKKYPVTLLLKGSRTLVAEDGQPVSYNITGNPGMASGGMGDTLTGLLAALIGQGLTCYDAARTGAWLTGRAAEIAVLNGPESEETLTATHLLPALGTAFKQLRAGCF